MANKKDKDMSDERNLFGMLDNILATHSEKVLQSLLENDALTSV